MLKVAKIIFCVSSFTFFLTYGITSLVHGNLDGIAYIACGALFLACVFLLHIVWFYQTEVVPNLEETNRLWKKTFDEFSPLLKYYMELCRYLLNGDVEAVKKLEEKEYNRTHLN